MSNKKHYVVEYATDKINSVKENSFMVSWIKQNIINSIKSTLDGYNKGLITTDEAMSLIASA